MSTQYNNEPTPTAKVLLLTSVGDIEIEIFAKQTPLASRNFLQHCLDGYYDGTIFHRFVPKFVIQGGDPTGTGSGGESCYDGGLAFKDEFHNRLKFSRRGLLGMANSGKKDDNQSQFFFTLDAAPELDNKNTMFGRVMGETWYNILKMVDQAENGGMVEGTDRPTYPSKVLSTKVLVNFFNDMVPRKMEKSVQDSKPKVQDKKPKRKAHVALLSFGDDASAVPVPTRKKQRANPNLLYDHNQPGGEIQTATTAPPTTAKVPVISDSSHARDPSAHSDSEDSDDESVGKEDILAKTNKQIEELKASMRPRHSHQDVSAAPKKTALEAMVPATSIRGRRRGTAPSQADDDRAVALLAAFSQRLDTSFKDKTSAELPRHGTLKAEQTTVSIVDDGDAEALVCDLHFVLNCESCSKWDEDAQKEDEDVVSGWMTHALSFEKDRLGKNLEWKRKNEDELLVIDPRAKERELGIKGNGRKDKKER